MQVSSAAESDPIIGSTLGNDYLVLERIGVGGMAVVYLVEHQKLHKRFAAKVLSAQHAENLEARARFTQEAHAASQLDHENIVSISDFGVTTDGRPYFVMELLRGETLADRLEAGPMALEEVVAVGVPVVRALAHAHAEGIIHRDVKPENIFLVQRSQGRWGVKVLDFGIARLATNDRMTKTGEALGSPMYMSPEACRGDEVDQRSDIYSFGIVLYLMLAGRVPFADENLLKVLQMQVSSPLPLPSSFNADLPPALELILIRALAKDPEERYTTMEEFLFALEAALPAGSDALLIQAQFGTSTTPFPGTLDRIRTSARMSTAPPPNVSITGEQRLSSSNPSLSVTVPPAPVKRRGSLVAGVLFVVVAAGAGGYAWMQYSSSASSASSASSDQTASASRAALPSARANPAMAAPGSAAQVPAPAQPAAKEEVAAAADVPAQAETVEAPAVEATVTPNPAKKSAQPIRSMRATSRVTPANKRGDHAQVASVVAAATPAPAVVAVAAPPPIETPAPTQPSAPTPSPSPAVTAAPPPIPTPSEPSPAKPAPVVVGSMDATPTITNLDVNGPLSSSVVRRGVERALPALRTCYRAAATAQKKTPALKVSVSFEIDESSAATNVASGGGAFGSLSSCVKSAVGQITTQQAPDVGTAQVAVTFQFTPI
jgi:eukaryotic-like serine/threonine-protein kinase